MDEILEYLKKNPTYSLATVDAEGNPQVRPFGTIAKVNGALYIQTGMVKDVYKQIAAHPRAALCTFDHEAGTWLRVEADLVPDDSTETCDAVLNDYPNLRSMYTPGDGNCVVLRLDNIHATVSSFTAPTREIEA